METVIQIALVCLLCTLLGLVIRCSAPSIALCISLGVCVSAFLLLSPQIEKLSALIQELTAVSGLDGTLFLPLFKGAALAVLCKLSGELCRDGGQSSLASLVEMAGTMGILLLSVPLLYQVMELMVNIL